MKFKLWLEAETILNIPINKLWGWKPKMDEVFNDMQADRLSHTTGVPVIVSSLKRF